MMHRVIAVDPDRLESVNRSTPGEDHENPEVAEQGVLPFPDSKGSLVNRRDHLAWVVLFLFWAGWTMISSTSTATLAIQQKAKAAGFEATNCLYCHNEKLPKKNAATHNDRGKWLIAEKRKRSAKTVDPAWLKNYSGDKK